MLFASKWKNDTWSQMVYDNIPDSMVAVVPKDIETYCKNYTELNTDQRKRFYVMLFSCLAKFESGFNPKTAFIEAFYDAKGRNVVSAGLFQVSVESANSSRYGNKIKTTEQLFDPLTNIKVMISIVNYWMLKKKRIAVDIAPWSDGALSAYWSVFRKAERKASIAKDTLAVNFKGEIMSGYKRELNKVMIDYFDSKLKNNPAYIDAVKRNDARMIFGLSMEACVGIQEATGKNDGKMVEAIQDTVGSASGEPWCMALIQTCIANAERVTGIQSPIHVSELCYDVWHKTNKSQRVKIHPLYAAIAIWNDKGTIRGHTEMVKSADNKVFQAIGGNTSGTVKEVKREGNACVYTVRPMKTTGKRQLLGFLKPF